MTKPIGKVTHYYDKAMVVVVKLNDKVETDEIVKFKKGEEELEQKIESMQINHEAVKKGKKGDEVAIKVDQPVKVGAELHSA